MHENTDDQMVQDAPAAPQVCLLPTQENFPIIDSVFPYIYSCLLSSPSFSSGFMLPVERLPQGRLAKGASFWRTTKCTFLKCHLSNCVRESFFVMI